MKTITLADKEAILKGWFEAWKQMCDQPGNKFETVFFDCYCLYIVTSASLKISIHQLTFTAPNYLLKIGETEFSINEEAGLKFTSYFLERVNQRKKEYEYQMDYTGVRL